MDHKLPNRKLRKKLLLRLLLFFGAVVAVCIAIRIYKNNNIPGWVSFQEKSIKSSLLGEDIKITLSGRQITVVDPDGKISFSTDKEIKVQDVFVTDLDEDGDAEMIALLWKKGLYGKHKPFWVKEDEKHYSQHIFIYDITDKGKVTQKWFASDTGILIKRMKLMEKRDSYILAEDLKGDNTIWRWEDFGLKKVDNTVKFIVFGDNIIHEAIYEYANRSENKTFDFLYEPFLKEIQSADIAAVNAETVLVEDESLVSGYPVFGSPIAAGEALLNAGFDVINCANNHVLDKGVKALDATCSFYKEKGAVCVGIQNSDEKEYRPYELIKRNGITFAVFSYTYGTNVGKASERYPNMIHYLPENSEEEEKLISDIKKSRQKADIVIVFAHWGDEYKKEISESQEHLTEVFAKAGADVVIGTHPHVVQEMRTVERPDGKKMTVYYSLGNFRADQARDENTKKGAEAVVEIWHTYDGVCVKNCSIKEIDAYWKK